MGFTGGGDPSGGKAIYRSDGFLHVWNPRQKSPATDWEKRIDEIMDAQEVEFDPDKRKALIDEMQNIFSTELPLLFLITPMSYSGVSKKWENVRVPPIGSVIWNIDELYEGVRKNAKKMLKFIARRMLSMVPLMLGISALVFLLMYLSPGDFLSEARNSKDISPEIVKQEEIRLGLDKPVVCPIRKVAKLRLPRKDKPAAT